MERVPIETRLLDLTQITKTEVVQEQFPEKYHLQDRFKKKYFRFNCYYGKPFPEFSSGRFKSEETAKVALDLFLHGCSERIFGNVNKDGK